jgi:hypothetical protein
MNWYLSIIVFRYSFSHVRVSLQSKFFRTSGHYFRTVAYLVKPGAEAHHNKFPTSQYLSSSYLHCSGRRGMARLGRLRRLCNFMNLVFPTLHPCRFNLSSKSTTFNHEGSGHPLIILALWVSKIFWSKFKGSHEEDHFRVHHTGLARLAPSSLLA